MTTRRSFLELAGCLAAGPQVSALAEPDLITSIEQTTIWRGRQAGVVWFHPRACRVPAKPHPILLMTVQSISGSDVFGPVHWSKSTDAGRSWSAPEPIPGMGRRLHPDGIEEGVCDVVPEFHEKTKTVLAMGHNVYYKNQVLTRPSERRWPVYVVRDARGDWSAPRKLEWTHPEATAMYTSGCSQRITLATGDILISLSFGPLGRMDRAVATALCGFDGKQVSVKRIGNILRLPVKRGLLEPTLALFENRYFMTIRAEDDRGYVTSSPNGLDWEEKRPWSWDNGEPLTLSSTQQRWLPHSRGLFLVYTRRTDLNAKVMRWRSPLFVAQVDTARMVLLRKTEKVVIPLYGDPVNDPAGVAHLGNFHTVAATRDESLVTCGEVMPKSFRGDTLVARLRWARPNALVD